MLVAPLDWGLGHATRCIPLIRSLLQKGCHVFIATDGAQEKLLQMEFPELVFLKLPGYDITYSKKWLLGHLSMQLLKMKQSIEREHLFLTDVIKEYDIQWVISDNRYGLHAQIPSTIITHQLHVQLPVLFKWAEKYVQQQLYIHINKFTSCWVPDLLDNDRGLSGVLGHPVKKPFIPVSYIGWLSRLAAQHQQESNRYEALIILSGPEPQRTMLEKKLLAQLEQSKESLLLVRGLPNETSHPTLPDNIAVHNHLPAAEMAAAFAQSEYVISRSGYSTLMDAFSLQKKCILIPTPGQTEQEYLSKRLAEKNMALVYEQDDFNLEKALSKASTFTFHFPLNTMNNLMEMAIDNFLLTHFNIVIGPLA